MLSKNIGVCPVIFYSLLMKSPLELQLNQHIKHANRLFNTNKYNQAIDKYTQSLDLYSQNRKYNDSIAPDFELVIYSLRGLAFKSAQKYPQAQRDYDHCLNLNPYNPLTLHRRAKLYIDQNRIGQAIQDVEKAMLYQPQCNEYQTLLSEINGRIKNLVDQQQKSRLQSLFNHLKNQYKDFPQQNDQQQENQQELINFSNLKKIDRVSLKIVPKNKHCIRKSVLCFKEDEVIEYCSSNQIEGKQSQLTAQQIKTKMQEQDQELKSLQEMEEKNSHQSISEQPEVTISINIIKQPSIHRNLLRNSSFFMSEQSVDSQVRLRGNSTISDANSINALSVKNIDGKILKNNSQSHNVKFISSSSNFKEVDCKIESPVKKQSNKVRKSILRCSAGGNFTQVSEKLVQPEDKIENINRSSFFGLKKIQSFINGKRNSIVKQQKKLQDKQNSPCKIGLDYASSSDDEVNQHQVFNQSNANEEEILKVLENMAKLSGGGSHRAQSHRNSKKSILKSNLNASASIYNTTNTINISHNMPTCWKKATKSVCFKTN